MTATWRRGQGYTEEIPALPPGPPTVNRRSPPPPGNWETQARRTLTVIAIVMTMILVALGVLWGARELGRDEVDRARIERWEDRIDALDSSAVQLFDPELSGGEKRALELRLEHLQRSLCSDLEAYLTRIPEHLQEAYRQICEAG